MDVHKLMVLHKMTDEDVRSLFSDMADRLRDKGWLQGELWIDDENGIHATCLQGACTVIVQDVTDTGGLLSHVAAERLSMTVHQLFPDRILEDDNFWGTVVRFNDHPDTTLEDVLLVIKHAKEMT